MNKPRRGEKNTAGGEENREAASGTPRRRQRMKLSPEGAPENIMSGRDEPGPSRTSAKKIFILVKGQSKCLYTMGIYFDKSHLCFCFWAIDGGLKGVV